MDRHGRSCGMGFHGNPLYTFHSGPQWCLTDSSGGVLDETQLDQHVLTMVLQIPQPLRVL